MLVWQGPESASHTVVLAPGDEGRLSDPAPTRIAESLAAAGLRVVRFAAPTVHGDGPERDAVLCALIREAAAATAPGQRLILGGLSRGARVGVELAAPLGACGLLLFAYPFHPRHAPDPGTRVTQLAAARVPVLLFQGTRDSHGNQQQVQGYGLPAHVQLHWLEGANHALVPRPSSGLTQAAQLARVGPLTVDFVSRVCS